MTQPKLPLVPLIPREIDLTRLFFGTPQEQEEERSKRDGQVSRQRELE